MLRLRQATAMARVKQLGTNEPSSNRGYRNGQPAVEAYPEGKLSRAGSQGERNRKILLNSDIDGRYSWLEDPTSRARIVLILRQVRSGPAILTVRITISAGIGPGLVGSTQPWHGRSKLTQKQTSKRRVGRFLRSRFRLTQ